MKRLYRLVILSLTLCFALSLQAQVDRTKAPVAGPAPKIQLGNYDTFSLKNGLKVLVVENHKIPKVSFSLSLNIDPIVEGDKSGYISIAGSLLEMGTMTKTAQQIAEEVDFIGADLNSYSKGVYAAGLSKFKDQILQLMADVCLHPSFPKSEFDKLVKQNLTGLQANKTSARYIASNVKDRVLYGKLHPYGDVTTESTIANIELADCENYYNTYFKPNVAILAIVGDITTKEAKKLVKEYFQNWQPSEVPAHKYAIPAMPKGKRVIFSNKDASPQSLVQVINLINLKKGASDVISASVMNAMLGRGFSGLLMKNLREDKAYTYGAYSRLSSDQLVGEFSASSNVRSNVTDSALIQIEYEMNRIRNEKLTQDHLDMTKATLAGDFARSLEKPSTIANFAMSIEKYNLSKDYYATYLEKLAKVSLDDVLAMAQKYVDPENAVYLVVGDRKLKNSLKNISATHEVEEFDNEGEKVVEDPNAIPVGLTSKAILENYINAIGGREKVEAMKDLSLKGDMKMGPMIMNIETIFKGNTKYCMKVMMNGQVMQSVLFDGDKAKIMAMGKETQATEEQLKNFKLEAQMCSELNFDALGFTAKIVGSELIDGEKAYKLEVIDPSGVTQFDFYSSKSGLKVKTIAQQSGKSVIIRYKDYEEVEGIKFPFTTVTSMGPQEMPLTITELKVNKGVEDSVFN
ncbi:M16 family metallopeptidase [Ancylomarina longa]|uniref:Insulinase family protein n=1 Tax=Ancylomarina longa TaxID=2487017 RepID=A0A434AVZ3_9BACT|nr:pitrilysin family protein [Ancylomarina longa]RUT78641.1 insulinase family protein [Ancylomarina longa]